MASHLRNKAVERSIKTNTAAYYSYVDENKNPVLQSFENQISDFKNYVAKQPRASPSVDGRLSETLFQLWGNFQARVSVRLYCEKLMHVGEFLVAHGKYNLALFQCYQRYLNEFGAFHMHDFQTTEQIEERFFPRGLSDATADISFQALMGCALCLFFLSVERDPKVQLDETLDRCIIALSFTRLLMNLALKDDHWSWLVYNGTIYLYQMSRYLMALGYSVQVVEYLVWAAVSTEMCLPLLSITYLTWRATLYCAACEAFYDSRTPPDGERALTGENFARRALEQFKNLHELQALSVEGDKCQVESSFRFATIKVATMIFKRMVFESRRKARGVLRPKIRQNNKEISGVWPRTLTEKLLSDMFDCRCAQFLAILEALSNSHRRLVLTAPASEQEPEVLEVATELFHAAHYILQVKHANVDQIAGANENEVFPNVTLKEDANLLDLAVNGRYVIPLSYVLRLLKLAFNYQANEIFESMMGPISELVDKAGGSQTSVLAFLQILYEIEQVEKERKNAPVLKKGETKKARGKSPPKTKEGARKKSPERVKEKLKTPKAVKDLIDAAKGTRIEPDAEAPAAQPVNEERSIEELLEDLSFLLLMDPQIQEKIEPDALIDVSLLLWNKCRPVLRRIYNEPNDNARWLTRLDHDHLKWIRLCFQTHEIMSRFNFAVVDPSAYAECSLRLGQILCVLIQPSPVIEATIRTSAYRQRYEQMRESVNHSSAKPALQAYLDEWKRQQIAAEASDPKEEKCRRYQSHSAETHSLLPSSALTSSSQFSLAFFAEQFLARSLKVLAQARSNLIRSDGYSLFDRHWSAKSSEDEDDTDSFSQVRFFATQPFHMEKGQTSKLMDNLVKDLDAELHFVYCRAVTLLEQTPDAKTIKKGPIDQYLTDARGNSHKKALLCAAYASVQRDENVAGEYMQKAYKHLLAAEEEDRLYFWHYHNQKSEKPSNNAVPRPCVLARAPDFVFVMAPDFGPLASQVATYRIFCRAADRPNAKARMADTSYSGSGQQIPASFVKPVKISGLDPDLKYIFSLAIYDAQGKLIGESVSESTEPVLAANPISLLFVRCLLSQVSYEIKQYAVAKKAFHSIWTYFVRTPPKIESSIREIATENPLVLHELRYSCVGESSISLLQKFINTIFINLEVFVKENHYYCDMITPASSNRTTQINRIHACSQLLIALELSCWLNDAQYTLQAMIYLYGLLTPLIFHRIFFSSLQHIFDKCLAVLEEISPHIAKQRTRLAQENLYHMIACITAYLTQYLRDNNELQMSTVVQQIGKRILSTMTSAQANESSRAGQSSASGAHGPTILSDEAAEQIMPKSYYAAIHNEELKALERFVAKERNTQAALSGNEEPATVFSFINTTSALHAYKEIQKFRKRPVYMEYLSQVLIKSLLDPSNDEILNWYDENQAFVTKRNDLLLGPWRMVIAKSEDIIAVLGNNENKYAAAVTEFTPEQKKNPQLGIKKKRPANAKKLLRARPAKYHFLIPAKTVDVARKEIEQRQKPAIDKLFTHLPDLYHQSQARKKFRRFISEELVWRSQYELLNALYCLDRIPCVIKETNDKLQALLEDGRYRFDRLNPNLFTYDQSNLIIRKITDDEILDDPTLEVKPEFQFQRSDVKDRMAIISELVTGEISDPNVYLGQRGDGQHSVRDRKAPHASSIPHPKNLDRPNSPQHDSTDRPDHSHANDPYGFKHIRAYIDRFLVHYRRCIVMAHRSSNWTLLQNAAKSFYDSMEQLIQYLATSSLSKVFSINALLAHSYQTMFVASELLIDMLHRTKPFYDNQNDKAKNTSAHKLSQWFTNVECSWTGTTFNFEQPQDRTILIDLRFVRKFILRALHAMYVAAKWEKLGSIAMKFNAVSDHYFADLVSPLLIAAQTALLQQLRDRQTSMHQPHFEAAVAALGRPIHPDDFYTLRPEKLFRLPAEVYENALSALSLDSRLDPKGFDFYAQNNHALELISIPLDLEFSRKLLRQGLEKTYFSSRSILECRKMLAFYMFKQEQHLAKDLLIFAPASEGVPSQEGHRSPKKEAPTPLQHRPLTPGEPMNFSPLEENKNDTSPAMSITKEAVITAYQTLAKLLLGQNRRDQYCQVQSELGDMYFHCDKFMESKTVWCDVIDTILDGTDIVTTWFKKDAIKSLLSNRTQLIQKCGIWGCLLCAIVTSKLAKYHIHLNCDQHLQTCLLSAYFLRAILFYTLPHSEHDIDYSTLFIDDSAQVWPGVQLTSDEFRLNPSALMDALAYTSEALIRHDICLQVLPVIALYDVFALHCRNILHTVQARVVRLRALVQLNLFNEAHRLIYMLIDGQKLPSVQLPGHYRLSISDAHPSKSKPKFFDNGKSVISDHNIEALESLLTAKLSPSISHLYGTHLSIEFHYLLSLLFIRLAARIPVIADLDLFQNSELKQILTGPTSRTYRRRSVSGADGSVFKSTIFPDEPSRSFVHIKSYLVGTGKLFAEKCLSVLQQTDELSRDHPSNLESFEYQLLIDSLALLAECAHQCHLDQLAARYALETLKVLTTIGEDNIAEKKIANGAVRRKSSFPRASAITRHPHKTLNAQNTLFNARYSHNLNVYAWLKQRAELCYLILQQINTLGKVKGIDEHVREELAHVNDYIDYGLREAQQYQCESMHATFLLYKALENLSDLVNITENIQRLTTAGQLFQSALAQQNNLLSVDIVYKKSLAQILLWEHQCVQDFNATVTKLIEEKENDKLQSSILDFLMQTRERIQTTSSSHPRDWFALPIIPLNNLYSPLLLPLIFAKLRTATILVDFAYRSLDEYSPMSHLFENAQSLFRQCLSLNRALVERYVNIDFECLLHLARIGRLQKRINLTSTTTVPLKTVVQKLLDAIRLCYFSSNDAEFIQTCYFELAIVLLEYTRVSVDGTRKMSIKSLPLTRSQDPSKATTVDQASLAKQLQMQARASVAVTSNNSQQQQQLQQQYQQEIKQAAAVAVRTATQMAVNQKQRVQLPGLAEEFSETDELHWPTFLAGDILGYFVFPERQRIFKSEAEREVLTLAPHFEAKHLPESFDSKLERLNLAGTQDLTWLHLLNYQNAVAKRLDNRQLLAFDCDAVGRSNLFFLHVFPRFVRVTQTLQALLHYSSQCMSIYPSDIYHENVLENALVSTEKLSHRASSSSARTMRSAQTNGGATHDDDLEHCPNIHLDMLKKELTDEQLRTEFSLSWYSSNTIRIYNSLVQNQKLSPVFGFYTTAKDDMINVVSVPLEQLVRLHKKYMPLAQIADTDPKQINQNQIHGILRELFILLTGEQTVKIANDDEALSKIVPRLTDSDAYVQLEWFLNAKFGAQTNNMQLRNWFIETFKQSSNTLLSTTD